MTCLTFTMNKLFTFALLVVAIRFLSASKIECEKIEDYDGGYVPEKTCLMRSATTINGSGYTISTRDLTIGGLAFDSNKNIRYLPEKVAKKFPNLLAYWASDCSLTKISKIHFEALTKLREISLHSNRIEKITSNTFKDSTSLKNLDLGEKFLFHDWFQINLKLQHF